MDAELPGGPLPPELRALLARAIRESPGEEVCGYLLAAPRGAPRFVRVANLPDWPGGLSVPARETARVERMAARAGERVLAFVHSHFSGLDLSDADAASLRRSALPWIVAVLRDGELEVACHAPPGR